MAVSVVMPALEMAQETGKLLAWLKKEGESVKKGEPLLEIETDKVTVEVEAPADGVLASLKAHEGADVPVGQTIAWIVRRWLPRCGSERTLEIGRRLDHDWFLAAIGGNEGEMLHAVRAVLLFITYEEGDPLSVRAPFRPRASAGHIRWRERFLSRTGLCIRHEHL